MKTLEQVMSEYPNLTREGMDIPGSEGFEKRRLYLISRAHEEINCAMDFIDGAVVTKRPNKNWSSYNIKEFAEREYQTYITNGSMICALLMMEIPIAEFKNEIQHRYSVSAFISNKWLMERIRRRTDLMS